MIKKTSIQIILQLAIVLFGSVGSMGQTLKSTSESTTNYPFELPDTITANFEIQTQEIEQANNKLLGYNIFHFTSTTDKDFIRKFDPITIRFPHGVWANFYNWETDGYDTYGDTWDHGSHDDVLEIYKKNNIKAGFPGLTALHNEKKQSNGVGYDMIWTYNLNYDDNAKNVARLKDSDAKGFDVRDIEIGNEHFWKTQRSTRTSTPEKFVALAKSLTDTMKQVKPEVRLSIPLSWRATHADYNTILADDKNYFDAVTIHKYTGADPDVPGESDKAYSTILTGRLTMAKDVNFARSFAPGKPVWLTEWGVSGGDRFHWAAGLGMADCYLYLFENQDIYERANWFSVNGVLNSFITISDNRVIKYPLEKTGYGSVYEILRSVFENSKLLGGSMTTSKLNTSLGTTNAVNARAVKKDGKIIIFTVNLTDKPVKFNAKLDGAIYEKRIIHEAMAHDDLAAEPVLGIDINPLAAVMDGQGEIILPPLSVNRITFAGDPIPVENDIDFISPVNGAVLDEGTNLIVEASVGSAVDSVVLYFNDELVRNLTGGPYKWGVDTLSDVQLKNISAGYHKLKLVATSDSMVVADSIYIEVLEKVGEQSPYAGIIAIPGKFEAENYDKGGEGVAYHDSDGYNQGGSYRSDGVDIAASGTGYTIAYSSGKEWLEYTIDVAEDGEYDIVISYSSARPGGGAKIGVSLPDENIELVESFELPVTGNWSTHEEITIASNVTLTKGKHILRLTVKDRGYNLDWAEIKKSHIVSAEERIGNKLMVYPNPNSNGIFNLSKWSKWEVYSIVGQKMLGREGNQADISQFPKGLYILKTEVSIHKILYE